MPAEAFETVSEAMGRVQARSSGEFAFTSPALAEKFAHDVLDRYNPMGYGSWATVRGTVVKWAVGSAD